VSLKYINEVEAERFAIAAHSVAKGIPSYVLWLVGLATLLLIERIDRTAVGLWCVVALVAAVVEYLVITHLQRTASPVAAPARWEQKLLVVTAIEASLVSGGVMLLVDVQSRVVVYLAVLLLVLPGYASALVLAASIRAHYVWMLGLFVPICIRLGLTDDSYYQLLAAIIALAGVPSSIYIGKVMHKVFMQTLQLRFENHELLKQLRMEKQRAEKASTDKTRFLASASHDLRQPMHALMLFAGSLEAQLQSPGQHQTMGKLRQSLDSINGLLESLLDISRLDAGLVSFALQPVAL
jgi:two-component system, sensor histidine kinase